MMADAAKGVDETMSVGSLEVPQIVPGLRKSSK
jgi:hypothetical protein